MFSFFKTFNKQFLFYIYLLSCCPKECLFRQHMIIFIFPPFLFQPIFAISVTETLYKQTPEPGSKPPKFKPIFNWMHWLVGTVTYVLASKSQWHSISLETHVSSSMPKSFLVEIQKLALWLPTWQRPASSSQSSQVCQPLVASSPGTRC